MKLKTIMIIVGFFLFSKGIYTYTTTGERTITIDKSEMVISSGGKGGKYLVFTENNGVFENTDSFFRFKFDSSDMYNTLKQGQTYKVKYYGWRIPFLSMYPNIYEAEKK